MNKISPSLFEVNNKNVIIKHYPEFILHLNLWESAKCVVKCNHLYSLMNYIVTYRYINVQNIDRRNIIMTIKYLSYRNTNRLFIV